MECPLLSKAAHHKDVLGASMFPPQFISTLSPHHCSLWHLGSVSALRPPILTCVLKAKCEFVSSGQKVDCKLTGDYRSRTFSLLWKTLNLWSLLLSPGSFDYEHFHFLSPVHLILSCPYWHKLDLRVNVKYCWDFQQWIPNVCFWKSSLTHPWSPCAQLPPPHPPTPTLSKTASNSALLWTCSDKSNSAAINIFF
jgi:hypothetical protein